MARAEVIGDPIAHSRSPLIHGFWLKALGLDGDYRATRVEPDGLEAFFSARRTDPDWRGCNVTAPHKIAAIPFLDRLSDAAGQTGAVNTVVCEDGTLIGHNTDVDGIAEALMGAGIMGRKVVLIGAGGAARAAMTYLTGASAGEIRVLARDPARAAGLLVQAGKARALPFEQAGIAIEGASLIVNASPLGMNHAAPMPDGLLAALAGAAPGARAFDMVYQPLDTPFLGAARRHGLIGVDGLSMLIGQAREAFRRFFGAEPPGESDGNLRAALGAS
jgi:shikimate dehydrogenase